MTRPRMIALQAAFFVTVMAVFIGLWALFPPAGCSVPDLWSFERCGNSRLDVGWRSGLFTGIGLAVAWSGVWLLLKWRYRRRRAQA